MKNTEVSKTVYVKILRKWEVSHTVTNETEVYDSLAHDLINKKIHCCNYIKSIKHTPNYNGTQTITVNYDNDCKAVYIIPSH